MNANDWNFQVPVQQPSFMQPTQQLTLQQPFVQQFPWQQLPVQPAFYQQTLMPALVNTQPMVSRFSKEESIYESFSSHKILF